MHQLAVAGDRDHRARHALRRDLAGEEIVHPRKALCRESDLVGLGLGQRPGSGNIECNACGKGRGNQRLHEILPGARIKPRDCYYGIYARADFML